MSPCYEPPETYHPQWGYVTMREDKDRLVNTLKDIEAVCKQQAGDGFGQVAEGKRRLAQEIMSIIAQSSKEKG